MKPVPERLAARAAGERFYRTGKPCQNGHVDGRYTATGKCQTCTANGHQRLLVAHAGMKELRAAKAAEWKRANPEKKRAQANKWRQQNPDKISEYNKRWRKANPEKAKANHDRHRKRDPEKYRNYVRAWAKRNPERAVLVQRTSKINRRARKAQNGGKATADDLAHIIKRQKNKCAECGKKRKLTVDHITAIANGGSGDPANLQMLCFPCNRSKSDKDVIAWAREHGRLL